MTKEAGSCQALILCTIRWPGSILHVGPVLLQDIAVDNSTGWLKKEIEKKCSQHARSWRARWFFSTCFSFCLFVCFPWGFASIQALHVFQWINWRKVAFLPSLNFRGAQHHQATGISLIFRFIAYYYSQVGKFNPVIGRVDAIFSEFNQRLLALETTSYSGVFVWKIPTFRHFLEEARSGRKTSLYSPPFYTSRSGYKMCGRIYPNGDGSGKGTHLSFFFVMMKGEFDALLTWPFRQKVSLTLLDQTPAKRHITDTFCPDVNSSSFQRPVSEMNIASGCPRFVSHEAWHASTSYLRDDALLLRIAVDCQGL